MQATQHDSTGFNLEFGKTWIYPSNLPIRQYQRDIVQEALFKNTMVCLPTGLGKTFIAAVVMYNYYRWYPSGKVIFMATTKPLVKQQVDACYNIVAIPKDSTVELTGSVIKQNRESLWKDKRVFFVTPQVLRNDLDTIEGLGAKIKCIVIDEAHRARGNHAYCEVINKLLELNKEFRVLALTATPASNIVEVINICNQLLISHLEVRTEDSADVLPYSHKKTMQTIVLKLDGKLSEVITDYKKILDKYIRILVEHKVIHSNFSSLHKGRLYYLSKEYQEKNTHNRSSENYKLITKTFATCTILYHAFDLLLRHGLRSFLHFFEESVNKPLLCGCSSEILGLMEDITKYVGPPLVCDKLPDGSHVKLPENCKFGHPKFYKLREILHEHFANHDVNSKVIIFCEYKDSVAEAYACLLEQKSIKPKMFMGQSSITQKQQINIIESFRSGTFNTLISTCIGEEGIDVGFVDMVICFDISNKSSLRFVQRIGRTGRDRNGRVVILVSEGREQQVLKECLQEKQHLCNTLIHAKNIDDKLYKNDPRMIPDYITPVCQELCIVPKKTANITNFFTRSTRQNSIGHRSSSLDLSQGDLTLNANITVSDYIPKSNFLILNDVSEVSDCFKFNFNKNIDNQRSSSPVYVPNSLKTELFIDTMKQIEYARYNLKPTLKSYEIISSLNSNTKKTAKVTSKKQTDIRNMFKQCSQVQKSIPQETPLDMLLECKINNICASTKDCGLCVKFTQNTIIKKDFVCINNLNLKVNYDFNLNAICVMQNKISERLNKLSESKKANEELNRKEFMSFVSLQTTSEINANIGTCNTDIQNDAFDSLLQLNTTNSKSTNENEINNLLDESPVKQQIVETKLKSPDLFDDDFPVFSPPNIQETDVAELESNNEQITNENVAQNVELIAKHVDLVETKDLDQDIIEASPSPVLNKRKASQSSVCSSRSKKRIKFDVADIFDVTTLKPVTTVTVSKDKKKKIMSSDLFDLNFVHQSKTNENQSNINTNQSEIDKNEISPLSFSPIKVRSDLFPSNKQNQTFANDFEVKSNLKPINKCFSTPRNKIKPSDLFDFNSIRNNVNNNEIVNKTETKTTEKEQKSASDLPNLNLNQSFNSDGSVESNISVNQSKKPRTVKKKILMADLFDFNAKTTNELCNTPLRQDLSKKDNSDFNDKNVPEPRMSTNSPRDSVLSQDISDQTSVGTLSPDLSSFIVPTNPISPKVRRFKKQITACDLFDTSKLPLISELVPKVKENAGIINLSVLKSPGGIFALPSSSALPKTSLYRLKSASSVESIESIKSVESGSTKSFGIVNVRSLASSQSTSSLSSIESNTISTKNTKTARKKRGRAFIDSEADVSSDAVNSDDEFIGSQDDCYDASFVNDDDASFAPCTQTQAMYLQSVRSPLVRGKPLRRVVGKHVDDTQIMHETIDLTYAKDSFVVDSDHVEEVESLDELEQAELELKKRKRNRKKRIDSDGQDNVVKRRRIRVIESDSD